MVAHTNISHPRPSENFFLVYQLLDDRHISLKTKSQALVIPGFENLTDYNNSSSNINDR